MNKQPKISVLMPSLNVSQYIGACLESVVRQTFCDIEIICIDAGSTDGTLEIIETYANADGRISVIHSDKKSYGYQMNMGLKAAEGEYIGIVETDDFIDPEMYRKLAEAASNNPSADYIKCGFVRYTEFGGKSHKINTKFCVPENQMNQLIELDKFPEIRLKDANHIWTGIYKKSFLDQNDICFNETPGASFQDTGFSLLVSLLAQNCLFINRYDYYYRVDNINSSVKNDSKISNVIDEKKFVEKFLKEKEQNSLLKKEIMAKRMLGSYIWNYNRLSKNGRYLFLNALESEIREYIDGQYSDFNYTENELEQIKILNDLSLVEEVMRKEKHNNECNAEFLNCLSDNNEYAIVGTLSLSKWVMEMIEFVNPGSAIHIYDNNKEKQGLKFHGIPIESIDAKITENLDMKWIITSKNHSEEISSQLADLGINMVNIISVKRSIPLEEVLKYFL